MIFMCHLDDKITRNAMRVILDTSHDKRINQKTLDFLRKDYKNWLSKNNGNIILLIYFDAQTPIGLSCMTITVDNFVKFSTTVVIKNKRRCGIGKKLLKRKLDITMSMFPKINNKFFAAVSNKPGRLLIESVGFSATTTRINKNNKKYLVFEKLQSADEITIGNE